MPYGNIARHPSYHNRYRSFGSEDGNDNQRRVIIRSVSEVVAHEEQEPRSPDNLVQSETPESSSSAPNSEISGGARAKRAKFKASRSMLSGKALCQSTESNPDEVFVDMREHDVITDPSDLIKMVEKRQLKAALSSASTATLLPNPYNKINHRIHSFFWCTCCLYFVFICCLPGVHYMQESDEAFKEGDEKRAQRLGKMATLMFIAGALFSLALYGAILFVVIFFTAYQ